MCGINGIFAFNEVGAFYMINHSRALDAQKLRGPDARGHYMDDRVALGHRRLSIVDTHAEANQPMYDESGRYVLVFNGEIFNFKVLKQQCINRGLHFKTESDTEVLLQLLIHEGEKALDLLIGFFAFAFYDKQEQTILLARDRFGIKPLVYFSDEDKFVFASELKSLMQYNIGKNLDVASMQQYFLLNYIPAPHTIYQNVFKLEPGHLIRVKKKQVDIVQYYKNEFFPKGDFNYSSVEEAQQDLYRLMEDSVRLRMFADVPLGAFLSGGLDSSVIAALAARETKYLNTFSIGYADEPFFDETHYANAVAKKIESTHTVFKLKNDDFAAHIHDMLSYIDEPFGDSSALPFYILSKETARKVKVALSGDGADELFAGYNKYKAEHLFTQGGWAPQMVKSLSFLWDILPSDRNALFSNKIRQFKKFAALKNPNPFFGKHTIFNRYLHLTCLRNMPEAMDLFKNKASSEECKNRINKIGKAFEGYRESDKNSVQYFLNSDIRLVLPNDMLYKADMMSMANGLEVRVPFLDHRVVEWAQRLPQQYKIDQNSKKKIVQDTFRHLLPEELYNRPKKGFDVPLVKWYRRELRNLLKDELFQPDFIREQGLFEPKAIEQMLDQVLVGQHHDQEKVWNLIVFQYWYKNVFSKK